MYEVPTAGPATQLVLNKQQYIITIKQLFLNPVAGSCVSSVDKWPCCDVYHCFLGSSWRRCQAPGRKPQQTQTCSAKLRMSTLRALPSPEPTRQEVFASVPREPRKVATSCCWNQQEYAGHCKRPVTNKS